MANYKLYLVTFILIGGFASCCFCGSTSSTSNNDESSMCQVLNKRSGETKRIDCLLDPEVVEGPYWLPLNLSRSDITEGIIGVPLALEFVVMNSITCRPIPNAVVDIWHAEPFGTYSGFESEGTTNQTFLRGIQTTDENGVVNFTTIYPGWYGIRCLHIHIQVFLNGQSKHTGQLFFENSITNSVRSAYPYNNRTDVPHWNEEDSIFMGQGGIYTIFDGPEGDTDSGFSGLMYIGVNPQAPVREAIKHY